MVIQLNSSVGGFFAGNLTFLVRPLGVYKDRP